jgi:hypothetical protein
MNGDVDAVFAALSDPMRRRVIRYLSEEGPVTATELAHRLPVSRQAIEGRSRRFRLTPAPMREAMGWMADVGAEWDDRLESLRRHLSIPRD